MDSPTLQPQKPKRLTPRNLTPKQVQAAIRVRVKQIWEDAARRIIDGVDPVKSIESTGFTVYELSQALALKPGDQRWWRIVSGAFRKASAGTAKLVQLTERQAKGLGFPKVAQPVVFAKLQLSGRVEPIRLIFTDGVPWVEIWPGEV